MSIIWLNDLYRDLDKERNIIGSDFRNNSVSAQKRKLRLVETDMINQKLMQQILNELENQKEEECGYVSTT